MSSTTIDHGNTVQYKFTYESSGSGSAKFATWVVGADTMFLYSAEGTERETLTVEPQDVITAAILASSWGRVVDFTERTEVYPLAAADSGVPSVADLADLVRPAVLAATSAGGSVKLPAGASVSVSVDSAEPGHEFVAIMVRGLCLLPPSASVAGEDLKSLGRQLAAVADWQKSEFGPRTAAIKIFAEDQDHEPRLIAIGRPR